MTIVVLVTVALVLFRAAVHWYSKSGKDTDAGKALYKAQREARKNMIYVDRFDGRTIFHDRNEEYRATKFVVRQRRAEHQRELTADLHRVA